MGTFSSGTQVPLINRQCERYTLPLRYLPYCIPPRQSNSMENIFLGNPLFSKKKLYFIMSITRKFKVVIVIYNAYIVPCFGLLTMREEYLYRVDIKGTFTKY